MSRSEDDGTAIPGAPAIKSAFSPLRWCPVIIPVAGVPVTLPTDGF